MNDFVVKVEESKRLANWIGDQIDGLELTAGKRSRVAGALISVSLGHHASIVELFGAGRHGSALALMRSMIDCFVRAQWAAHLASDEKIERFITGDDPPGVQRLISNLEKGGPFEDGVLSSILSPTQWAVVCDFNHGGGRMIVRHLSPKEIAPNFDGEELLEAIVAANAWALVSACALADLAADKTLGERLLQKSAALAA